MGWYTTEAESTFPLINNCDGMFFANATTLQQQDTLDFMPLTTSSHLTSGGRQCGSHGHHGNIQDSTTKSRGWTHLIGWKLLEALLR